MKKHVTTVAAATTLAAISFAGMPAANAATAPVVQSNVSYSVPTSPNHDPSLAVIPSCKPWLLPSWLAGNFGDHGNDISAAFRSGNIGGLFRAIPQYAFNDAAFHLPATFRTFGGCF